MVRAVRLRCAVLGVGGLCVGGLAIACNAIFDIKDPDPNANVGTGGTSNEGGSGASDVGGTGGSSSGDGGSGDAGAGIGGSDNAGGSGSSDVDAGDSGGPTLTLSGVVRHFESEIA